MTDVEKYIGESAMKDRPEKKLNLRIKEGAIVTDLLGKGAVTNSKIADGAVTTDKLSGVDDPGGAAVTTSKIVDNAVTESKIAKDAVTSDKIQEDAINSDHIKESAVESRNIGDGQVLSRHIQDNAVTSDKLSGADSEAGAAVTAGKIAAGAIHTEHIAANAVVAGNIASGAVQEGNIAAGAVTAGKIAANAVVEGNIAEGAVTTAKIKDGSVTTNDIATGAVTEEKLAPGAITTDKLDTPVITQLQTIMDEVPTAGSVKPINSGGVLAHGSAFDVSEYNKSEGVLATYETLAAALDAVPATSRRGGMSIKFILRTNTGTEEEPVYNDEYVQHRYMCTSIATADFTNTANWQGVTGEIKAGSRNLAESGEVNAVAGEITFNRLIDNGVILENGSVNRAGANISSDIRVRTKDAFPTSVKRITAPDGFLVRGLFYYSSWTDKNNYVFAAYENLNQQSATIDTTYPYVRATFSNTENTDIDSEQLLLALFSANGYVFGGVVVPDSSLPPFKARLFCITATPGTYTNFNNIEVSAGELCILSSTNGKWTKNTISSRLHTSGSYARCSTKGNVAAKEVTIGGNYNTYNIIIVSFTNKNTADDVTLNINGTGALPLMYNGSRMSSSNCPDYAGALLLIYHSSDAGSYIGCSLPKFSSNGEGNNFDKDICVSQYTLSKRLLDNLKQPICLYQGNVVATSGKFENNSKRVYTQPLYGYIDIKVKSGYIIVGRNIFNNAGNRISFENISDSSMQYYCEYGNYCMITIRNADDTIDISPTENIIDYCYHSEIKKRPRVVDGIGRINDVVKEMYLEGIDPTKEYYISSIGKNTNTGKTSLAIKEVSSGNIVARFLKSGYEKYPNSFVTLSEVDNSGISGMAVVNWSDIPDLTLYTSTLVLLDSVYSLGNWPLLSLRMQSSATEFNKLVLAGDDGVVYTAWNYILKDITIDSVRYLQFSDDLGETFTQAENTFGDIVYVHFFSNGVCLFATANKCYYFSDISDISESTLLDYDGSPYVSDCVLDFFQNSQIRNDAMLVGGTEIVAWGNYSLGGDRDPNYVGRVWYSPDYGQTVKCAIKFGTTVISGAATAVRHTHGVIYNKYNEKFAVITGDYRSGCQLIEGEYDPINDTWTFTKLGQGDEFKFGDVLFRDNFVYFITDYTIGALDRGILRCPYPMLNDYTKYEYVYKIDRSSYTGSLSAFVEDKNGNRLIFPDGIGKGKIWYCKNNFKFALMPMSENVVLTDVCSPNYNGDIYVRKSLGESSFPFKLSGNMVNLTKSMRQSGCKDFFVQNVLI